MDQSKVKPRCVYTYIIPFAFHSIMLKKKIVTCELLIHSISAGWGQMLPCSSLVHTNSPFNLLFLISPSWAMLIKPTLFSLTSSAPVLSMRMEPHLSIVQTDWNHSPSRAHDDFTPRHLLYFNWKYSFSFFPPVKKGRSHLLHPCTVEAQQKTTLPKGILIPWLR